MKKLTIIIILLVITISSFAQKSAKNGFLRFKIPKGSALMIENSNNFLIEKENEQVLVISSQMCNLNKSIEQYFVFDDSIASKVKTEKYEYSKFIGKSNKLNWMGKGIIELYRYNQKNNYIAVIRIVDYIDDKTFMNFLNSIEINEKKTKWKTVENDLFSVYLPDLVGDKNIEENLSEITYNIIEDQYHVNIYVSDYYTKKTGYIPNSSSVKFSKNIYGQFYTINCFDEENHYISKEFYDKVKAGFKPKNNQPVGKVMPISHGYRHFQNYEGQPWEFLCVLEKNKLSFWNLKHNNIVGSTKKLKANPTSITSLDSEYLIVGDDIGNVQVFNDELSFIDDIKLQKHKAKINQIKHIYGFGIVSCSDDKTLKIHIPDLYENEPIITCKGHTDAVTCFDGNNDVVISGSKDNSIIIWNKEGKIKLTHNIHSDEITAIKILSEKIVVSASKDKTVKIWDFTNGKVIKIIKIDNGYAACFNIRDEISRTYKNYFAIGTSAGEIIVLDTKSYERNKVFKDNKEIKLISFYEHDKIMTVNSDNKIKFWQFERKKK